MSAGYPVQQSPSSADMNTAGVAASKGSQKRTTFLPGENARDFEGRSSASLATPPINSKTHFV